MEVFIPLAVIVLASIVGVLLVFAVSCVIIELVRAVNWTFAHADGRPRVQSAASEVVPSTTEEERPTNGRWPSE